MGTHMLVWALDPVVGFDSAWATSSAGRLSAEGQQVGLRPRPYSVRYRLETAERFVTARLTAESRWDGGTAALDLRRDGERGWTVDGAPRPDLADALDLDLAACPLTNTMPILRHALHRGPGDHEFLMAFIELPSLRVVASRQRYTHLRSLPGGAALVQYRSGSFESELTIDAEGFVVDYPRLGRRLEVTG